MSMQFSFGDLRMEPSHGRPSPREDEPFRILVLGDFSGRTGRGEPIGPLDRRAYLVDVDTLEELPGRLGTRVHVAVCSDGVLEVPLTSIDDLHPDHLVEHLDIFQTLLDLRRRLNDTRTFSAAAEEVRTWANVADDEPSSASDGGDPGFESLLGRPAGTGAGHSPIVRGSPAFDAMLRGLVAPHIVPAADPRQDEYVAAVDAALSDQLRRVLHDPCFACVESAWRALEFMATNIETDEDLTIHLLDISKNEITSDLSADDLSQSALYRLLVRDPANTPGGVPWALVVGLFGFEPTVADINLLGRLGRICSAAGAPLLSEARPGFIGIDRIRDQADPAGWTDSLSGEAGEAWSALRDLAEVRSIALGMPRFVLRMPYGARSNAVDAFDFNELADPAGAAGYVWGNPGVAMATLIAGAFRHSGWDFRAEGAGEIGGLPAYMYKEGGETVMAPCGEAWLTHTAGDALAARGFVPLMSIRGRDAIRVEGIRSIHAGGQLVGRWSR